MTAPKPIDIDLLLRPRARPKPHHINVRVSGDDAVIWQSFVARTPGLTDSQRVRDAVRVAAYCLARLDAGKPVHVHKGGGELLQWLEVLVP